jgi:hypothetical protein
VEIERPSSESSAEYRKVRTLIRFVIRLTAIGSMSICAYGLLKLWVVGVKWYGQFIDLLFDALLLLIVAGLFAFLQRVLEWRKDRQKWSRLYASGMLLGLAFIIAAFLWVALLK